jgi:uncharacterized membrane protein YeaQ/YmgE (transglycosylase-associated protein family)
VPVMRHVKGQTAFPSRPCEETAMHLSNESLLVILLVGLVAGWLAGQIVQGTGFGLIGDLLIGIVGAFVGNWLLPRLGIHLGAGIVAAIVNATIGAVVLLLIVRLLRGGGRGWGWRGSRW